MMAGIVPALSDATSTASSSALTTPDSSYVGDEHPSLDSIEDVNVTPRAPSRAKMDLDASVRKLEEAQARRNREMTLASGIIDREKEKEKGRDDERDKAMMPPPPVPATSGSVNTPTPTRMARMPSLSQITEHLHIPSSGISPVSPPRLSLKTALPSTPSSKGTANATPNSNYAMSPSSRLKLPASAMTRSRSGSSGATPTLASLGMTRTGSAQSILTTASSPSVARGAGQALEVTPGSASTDATVTPTQSASLAGAGDEVKGGQMQRQQGQGHGHGHGRYVEGYKDVPSLAAIRNRMSISSPKDIGIEGPPSGSHAKTQVTEEDGQRRASDVESVDDVETLLEDVAVPAAGSKYQVGVLDQAVPGSSTEHPLRYSWTLYYDAKGYTPDFGMSAAKQSEGGLHSYAKSLLQVGTFASVQGFARHMNNLRLPSRLLKNANYHLFKDRILPMWEDPANAQGGKWVILFRSCPDIMDVAWANLVMALIGDMVDEESTSPICGIVASCRPKVDRIQVWTRGREDVKGLNELGRRLVDAMALERGEMENVSLEFQYNSSNSTPPAGLFMFIPFTSRSFSHSPATPSRLGASGSLPTLNLPAPTASSAEHRVPGPSSGSGQHGHPGSSLAPNVSPRTAHHSSLHPHTSPLQHSTRFDNNNNNTSSVSSSTSSVSPSPSPRMGGAAGSKYASLPKAPGEATIKASMSTSPSLSVSGNAGSGQGQGASGGTGMRRAGSGQGVGSSAFAGPMGGGMGMGLGIRGAGVGTGPTKGSVSSRAR